MGSEEFLWESQLLISMVRDLENTQDKYGGYAYRMTIRNILAGNADAAIAPFFKDKPYYGLYGRLSLDDVEGIMDSLVKANMLEVIYMDNGKKLYCTHEYYVDTCRRNL